MIGPGDIMHHTVRKNPNRESIKSTAATFFTIGYQAHSVDSLIAQLRRYKVQLLVDVRQNPSSRKAEFSKIRLQDAIAGAGMEYLHDPDLGTPPRIRSIYRNGRNLSDALAEYDKHLSSNPEPIESLAKAVGSKKICLLCLESDHRMCHRGIIARKLCEITQWQPIHLG
jgi:uncharacterized protein (DUF488 family)